MTDQHPETPSAEQPERVTDPFTTDEDVDGTTEGNPIAGVEIDEAELENAVEPDGVEGGSFEVDGPATGHA